MENNSVSTISPSWPTHWPRNSFNPAASAALFFGVVALVVFVMIAIVIALFIVHPELMPLARTNSPAVLPYEVAAQGAAELPIIPLVWLALPPLSGFSLRKLGFRVPTLNTIGVACVGAIIAILLSTLLGAVVDALSHGKHVQEVVKLFLQEHDFNSRLIFAIFAIGIGPMAEETFFRLFLFNLGLRYVGFYASAIISALLFAAMHMDPYALLPLAAAGFVFAWVYYQSRNAFASMIAHGLFNAFSFIVLLIAPKLAS